MSRAQAAVLGGGDDRRCEMVLRPPDRGCDLLDPDVEGAFLIPGGCAAELSGPDDRAGEEHPGVFIRRDVLEGLAGQAGDLVQSSRVDLLGRFGIECRKQKPDVVQRCELRGVHRHVECHQSLPCFSVHSARGAFIQPQMNGTGGEVWAIFRPPVSFIGRGWACFAGYPVHPARACGPALLLPACDLSGHEAPGLANPPGGQRALPRGV